jgi:hypothetical protein
MSVTTQILDSSSPSTLDAIDQAFEAVWKMLYAHVAPDSDQSRELRIELRQTLIGLAADGVTDPRECAGRRWRAWCFAFNRIAVARGGFGSTFNIPSREPRSA